MALLAGPCQGLNLVGLIRFRKRVVYVATPVAIRKALSPPRIVYSWSQRGGPMLYSGHSAFWGRSGSMFPSVKG